MQTKEKVAFVTTLAQDINLDGIVTRMTPSHVFLKLQSLPENFPGFGLHDPVDLLVISGKTLYRGAAQVLSHSGNELVLWLTTARWVERRRQTRRPCTLPVWLRAVGQEGQTAAWQQATIRDVSVGGVCLLVDPTFSLPRQLELIFSLPCAQLKTTPVRVITQVVSSQECPDGPTVVGVRFANLTSVDLRRLAVFVSEPQSRPRSEAIGARR